MMTLYSKRQRIGSRIGPQGNHGFVALMTIIIITAVALIVATTIVFKSIDQATTGTAEYNNARAWAANNNCVEYALGQLGTASQWNNLFGPSTRNNGYDSCYLAAVTATGTGGIYRLIKASSTVDIYTHKLKVEAATTTPPTVAATTTSVYTWMEVGDF